MRPPHESPQEGGPPPGERPSPARILGDLRFSVALENELAKLRPSGLPEGLRGPLPVVPGLAATLACRGLDVPGGDVFSLRRTSPAVLAAAGLDPELIARQTLGSAGSWASGRDAGGVPGLPGWGLLPAVDPPGTLVEVMAGVALAFRLRGESRVALLVTDAADADSGYWHEGLNLAAARRAPLVLVVHPGRPRGLPGERPGLQERAAFYGVDVVPAPGDDIERLFDAVGAAVIRARSGGGTQVVEVAGARDAAAAAEARLVDALQDSPPDAVSWEQVHRGVSSAVDAALRDGEAKRDSLLGVLPGGSPPTPFHLHVRPSSPVEESRR